MQQAACTPLGTFKTVNILRTTEIPLTEIPLTPLLCICQAFAKNVIEKQISFGSYSVGKLLSSQLTKVFISLLFVVHNGHSPFIREIEGAAHFGRDP